MAGQPDAGRQEAPDAGVDRVVPQQGRAQLDAHLAGAGAAVGGSETGVVPNEMAPSSSETSFSGAVFPLKYSAADRAGSAQGGDIGLERVRL